MSQWFWCLSAMSRLILSGSVHACVCMCLIRWWFTEDELRLLHVWVFRMFNLPLFLRTNYRSHVNSSLRIGSMHTHCIHTNGGEISSHYNSSVQYFSGAHVRTGCSVLFLMTVWVCKAGWQWHLTLWHHCLYLDSLLSAKWLWQQWLWLWHQHHATLMDGPEGYRIYTVVENYGLYSQSVLCVAAVSPLCCCRRKSKDVQCSCLGLTSLWVVLLTWAKQLWAMRLHSRNYEKSGSSICSVF